MKLDILVFASHPDDAELSCGGTIVRSVRQGRSVGIIDLTAGELGTRGSIEIRRQEAEESAGILGLTVRENLGFRDGFMQEDEGHLLKIISVVRKYRPQVLIANAICDRHPDHGIGGRLVARAAFLSGLRKIETGSEAWRPAHIFHYIQDRYMEPDFVVDISECFPQKMAAIQAFKSQFYDPQSREPETYISRKDFLRFIEARALEFGHKVNVTYGEGFVSPSPVLLRDLLF